jgi:hypothetical protein
MEPKEYYNMSGIDTNGLELKDKRCKYEFTDEEKYQISKKMARTITEKQELEEEKKSVMKDYTSKLAAKSVEISADSRRVYDGFELRQMPCWVIKDFEKDKLIFVRKDNNEIIDIVQMTDFDRQGNLDLKEQEEEKDVDEEKRENVKDEEKKDDQVS